MSRMKILDKKEFQQRLGSFYKEKYGERDSDDWFEQPAVNVWVFERDGEIITLKCHILTGEVSVRTEKRE